MTPEPISVDDVPVHLVNLALQTEGEAATASNRLRVARMLAAVLPAATTPLQEEITRLKEARVEAARRALRVGRRQDEVDQLTAELEKMRRKLAAAEARLNGMLPLGGCSCDGDPIECSHEAARSQAEERARQADSRAAALEAELADLREQNAELSTRLEKMTRKYGHLAEQLRRKQVAAARRPGPATSTPTTRQAPAHTTGDH